MSFIPLNKSVDLVCSGENLFAQTDLDDKTAGIILLILAIFVILASLFGVVKILNSLLKVEPFL